MNSTLFQDGDEAGCTSIHSSALLSTSRVVRCGRQSIGVVNVWAAERTRREMAIHELYSLVGTDEH